MFEMMSPLGLRQRRHEEILREAERARVADAGCKRRRNRTLTWELERVAGLLLKLPRRSKEELMATQSRSGERGRREKYG
jgi:hypothetical protein